MSWPVQGVTFDTGMLLALERRKHAAWVRYRRLLEAESTITVPAPVLGEWWRGRTDLREALLESVDIEPLTDAIARLAGEALARLPEATIVDAFVMSSAALRGDVVYTTDFEDLERLRTAFPGVRVLAI